MRKNKFNRHVLSRLLDWLMEHIFEHINSFNSPLVLLESNRRKRLNRKVCESKPQLENSALDSRFGARQCFRCFTSQHEKNSLKQQSKMADNKKFKALQLLMWNWLKTLRIKFGIIHVFPLKILLNQKYFCNEELCKSKKRGNNFATLYSQCFSTNFQNTSTVQ